MMRQSRTQIRLLLEQYGHVPSKALGQHFLADPNIVDKIVRTAGVGSGDNVLEVGAGTGTLTAALVATGARVVAVEFDRRLASLVSDTLGDKVELIAADVMKLDLGEVLGGDEWVLVANLPYNVGTPLVLDLLRNRPGVVRLVVMVQREVAERLCAAPGSRSYGIPSVVAALHADARIEFTVPPHVFWPPPDVQSAVVVLERTGDAAPERDVEAAIALAEAVFGQRRKMLRRSLTTVTGEPLAALERAGIEPTVRPEELEPADFLRLARAL